MHQLRKSQPHPLFNKLKDVRLDIRKNFFIVVGGGALQQVFQRSCGCPIPRSVKGQARWVLEQPGLVESILSSGRELDLNGL